MSKTKKLINEKTMILLRVVVGAAIYAAGFRLFMYPNNIVPGGVSGIAMIVNKLVGMPVGIMTIIINVPLFFAAWKLVGRNFMVGSLIGMLISSLVIDAIDLFIEGITYEPLLGAVFGGVMTGVGLGLVFAAGASTGGSDIVVRLMKIKYEYINTGNLMFIADCIVIIAGAIAFRSADSAMYAIICVFISSRLIDRVLYGFVFSKVCYIISDKHEEIGEAIMKRLDRGATYLYGQGARFGTDKKVVMCAIKPKQIVALKRIVNGIDESAFMMIVEAREVLGKGFSIGG